MCLSSSEEKHFFLIYICFSNLCILLNLPSAVLLCWDLSRLKKAVKVGGIMGLLCERKKIKMSTFSSYNSTRDLLNNIITMALFIL